MIIDINNLNLFNKKDIKSKTNKKLKNQIKKSHFISNSQQNH